MKETIKLAGVTFKNDDGTSRQDILAGIGRGYVTCKLVETKFQDKKTGIFEKAIKVFCNRNLIGWIPKRDLENSLTKHKTLTGCIDIYKDKYHVTLSAQEHPSSAQYAYMKAVCAKQNWLMPAYDKRAYAQVFEYMRINNLMLEPAVEKVR